MRTEELKAAVELLQAILSEMDEETNKADEKFGEWYFTNLARMRSGLMTKEDFDKNVWDCRHQFKSNLWNNVYEVQHALKNIVSAYETHAAKVAKLGEVLEKTKVIPIPQGWKEWDVLFEEDGSKDRMTVYAPDEEDAKEKVSKFCKGEVKSIEVKEVSHE